MTTPQATSEEIAKARQFLMEVRAVCRKHGIGIEQYHDGLVLFKLGQGECEFGSEHVRIDGSDIDLNEG